MPRVRDLLAPTTLTVAVIAAVLVLADSAREHDGISARVDPHVAADALDVRTGLLTHLARLLTLLGSEIVVGALALLLMITVLQRRGPFLACCVAAAMAASAGLTIGVKVAVERVRPGQADRLGPLDPSYSFPSGHTLNSAVLLGLVVLLLVPLIPSPPQRIAAAAVTALLAFGIGLSRLYLGYHWATDVVASWLIAIALLTLVRVAMILGTHRRWIPVRQRPGSRT
jgi:membrane-associated phospholipid phosphatase